MPSNSEIFAKLYNEALGNKTGRRAVSAPTYKINSDTAKALQTAAQHDQVYVEKTNIANRKATISNMKQRATAKKKRDAAMNKVAKTILKAVSDAKMEALKNTVEPKPKKKKSLLGKIGSHIPSPIRTAAKGGIDIVSRPSYAVNNAILKGVKAVNEGEPLWSLPDDVLYGAKRGLQGKDKTGYGQVVQESAKPFEAGGSGMPRAVKEFMPGPLQQFYGGKVLADVEKSNPAAAKWIKRGLGAVGDVGLDPLTYVGPGVVSKVAKERQIATTVARDAIESGAKEGSVRAVRKGLQKEAQTTFSDAIKSEFDKAMAGGATRQEAQKVAKSFSKDLIERSSPAEIAKQRLKDAVQRAMKRKLDEINPKIRAKEIWHPIQNAKGKYVFTTVGEKFDNLVSESIDDAMNTVRAGAQGGKPIFGKEMPKFIAEDVSNKIRKAQRDAIDPAVQRIRKSLVEEDVTKKLTANQIKQLRKNPLLNDLYETAERKIKEGKLSKTEIFNESYEEMMKHLDDQIKQVSDEILGEVGPLTHHTPTIRYLQGGGKIAERVGNGAAKVNDIWNASNAARAFSYRVHFPGYTSMLAQKVRSEGVRKYEDFFHEVEGIAKGSTKADRKAVQDALLHGQTLIGKQEELRQAVQKAYKDIWDDEIQYGVRKASNTPYDPNYAYRYVTNGGKMAEKSSFKKAVRDALKNGEDINAVADKVAAKSGLRTEDDAIKALLYRKRKSMRDQARMMFNDELVGNYHIASQDMSKAAADARGLVKLRASELSNPLKDGLRKGESYYLPKDIADVRNVFTKMSRMQGSEETREFLRQIDYVTNKFKTMSTIYYPAYHVRNMLGDMFMGLMDGVKMRDYSEILHKWKNRGTSMLKLGDHEVSMGDLLDEYDKTAKASGMYRTDINRSIGKNKVQHLSESREDFGRFVHFYHAMDEEYPKALRTYKNPKEAWEKASDAARFRVNKYKFDYSAVTPFEQGVMKRAIPFYTYMRKAVPTLTESLFLNPRVLNYTNKILNQLGNQDSAFNEFVIPEWMRSIGYSVMPGTAGNNEPWVLRNDMLPTNTFNDLFGVQDSETTSQGLAKNLLSRVNPLIQTPIELATGKDLFTGRPVNSLQDAIMNQMRPVGTAKSFQNKNLSEFLLQQSGIPLQQVKKGSQKRYIQEIQDVNQRISRKGFKVFLSGSKYVLKNKATGKVIKSGRSLKEVLPPELYSTKKPQSFLDPKHGQIPVAQKSK